MAPSTNVAGEVEFTTNSYTEMQTGLYSKAKDGSWVESTTEISIQPDGGAMGLNEQQQLYIPGSL